MKKYPLRSSIFLLLFSFIISLLLPQCAASFATQPSTQTSPSSSIITPSDINFPILYENEHLIAISKPPHIPHHDDPQSNQLGIISLLRHQQQQQSSFTYPHRLYGVHRLDRVTSGILLLAKSSDTANELVNKFKEREVNKYYMAISGKKPRKKKQGWVRGDMVLGRRGSYKLVNENKKEDEEKEDDGGKKSNYAVTRFFTAGLGNVPLSPLLHPKEVDNEEEVSSTTPKTAILFQPHTGKTHQLRVAAKSVGLPILGDARYGGGRVRVAGDDTTTTEADYFDRTYLHAAAIQFEIDNEEVCIYSPPPFGHLFSTTSELDDVFVGMMKKHCESDSILHHVDGRSML
ncbi:RNA pseudouridine synthase [Skeletonema marinoi]|uniref:RNA pseudouridine synthase n=1 Tax=Skeletonema marinoi TaxID=267567 RepID=A0AAD8Y4S2_9STRA|nr:RNA pseudouridine synthase [Skeletonema marinoi]